MNAKSTIILKLSKTMVIWQAFAFDVCNRFCPCKDIHRRRLRTFCCTRKIIFQYLRQFLGVSWNFILVHHFEALYTDC